MAKGSSEGVRGKRKIAAYDHKDKKRPNNPPVGLVTPQTDRDAGKKTYAFDPHLDPQLQWAGKAERLSFAVTTVSLHVHERIAAQTILEAVRKSNGNGATVSEQPSLFETANENPPLREAIDFYKHPGGWTNRLVAGDSLLVMNSLLEKEGMAGKVQMVYMDPPYGIKYGSNFQPFVNKRDVKDGKDEDLTQEPEMIKAFRDTWELGIHSYLTYLRDRLLLCRELLSESGSCFVQISDENVHHVRELMDEVFGARNFVSLITFKKTAGQTGKNLPSVADYILWFGKDKEKLKFHTIHRELSYGDEGTEAYSLLMLADGTMRQVTRAERIDNKLAPTGARPCQLVALHSERAGRPAGAGTAMHFPIDFQGRKYFPPGSRGWTTTSQGMEALINAGRIAAQGNSIRYIRYIEDYPAVALNSVWDDSQSGSGMDKMYVVQTNIKIVQRCIMMTTDPGDLVFDPTCGSGTTATVAEQWGRRWITCDTSRVAVTLAKQRLLTALFDYYELADPLQGVGGGFRYKTVPHVTLKSIANNPDIKPNMKKVDIDAAIARHADQETLYDQPYPDKSKARVTGPFTVEAVPAPSARPLSEVDVSPAIHADASIARSGESLRQAEWRSELLRCGVRAKGGQMLHFSRVEPLPGTRFLHADAETKDESRLRAVVSFGPEHAPLEQRQVAEAIEEAQLLVPKPKIVLFASFHFDPEAAKDIDETNWPGVTLLKVQMNTDLLTEDLKKKRASNESFWMIGQPDVAVRRVSSVGAPPPARTRRGAADAKYDAGAKNHRGEGAAPAAGADSGIRGEGAAPTLYEVEVYGFDYYDPAKGTIISGDSAKIAVWLLDPDYDGRSLFPRQVFFPMAGDKEGWARLAKNLQAEIDEDLIEAYRGSVSLPFDLGPHKRIAVKIVDDRGIESLKIVEIG